MQFTRAAEGKSDREGPSLELVLADGSVFPLKGKVYFADRQVDQGTGTIKVASLFPNPGNLLRPGQFAKIRALIETQKGALLVPQRAVTELQGRYQVAVVGPDNKVDLRWVTVGERTGPLWVIDEGLKPGERVIVEGIQKVKGLVAANARIGEAKALLFPNIRITGVAGWESAALKSLFTGPASFWDLITPGVTQPLFQVGRLRASVRATEAQKQEALLSYKKSIQQAFQEVSDALVGVRMLKEVRIESGKQVKALSQQTDLAYQRYFGGVTPYLEVLDSDRQLFESELRLTQDRANEYLAVIALYRALGGGWQTQENPGTLQHQKISTEKK